jgi:hypothetical protein
MWLHVVGGGWAHPLVVRIARSPGIGFATDNCCT